MNITILTVGKVKESYFRDAISEYSKRLSKYCKLEIIEVADEKTPDGASEKMEDMILEKEADRLLKYLNKDAYIFVLAIAGKQLDSVQLSQKIEQIGVQGKSHIIFIIGGSLGLHEKVVKKGDFLLSFSKMTFPHQMMRVVLLEQIYRSYRIMANEPYHK